MRRVGTPVVAAVLGMIVGGGCTRPAEVAGSAPVVVGTPAPVTAATSPPVPAPAVTASPTPVPTIPAPTIPAPTIPAPTSTSSSTTVPSSACVATLPLGWRAGQVLMPAVYGDGLTAAERLVDESEVGGIVLMTWPEGADPAALMALKTRSTVPLLVATDEEGGDVQRLRSLGRLPSQRDMAATSTPSGAREAIARHATAVAALGVDLVLGPVVDVGSAPPIGSRSFGDDPATVAEFAGAYVDGWASAGLTPVLKHFPGHGRASADTHEATASTPPIDELLAHDLVPYRELADRPGVAVMVGHLDTPGLTDGGPASLSAGAIDLLRSLGFADALIVTDALDMGAVSAVHDLPDAVVLALAAGADVALYTDWGRTGEVRTAVVSAVEAGRLAPGRLDEAVTRVLAAKGVDPCTVRPGRG